METERGGEKQAVSEEDAAKAEAMKNKANEFFKCESCYRGLGVKTVHRLFQFLVAYIYVFMECVLVGDVLWFSWWASCPDPIPHKRSPS